ncbi:MAG: hypothetical protein ACOC8L_13290 [Spirochaetota bacterium]
MGVQIFLTVKGGDISPKLWERIYAESLVLLENFPAKLTRLKAEEIRDEKRYVYTPEIVCNRNAPTEHWTVDGDMTSRQEAEPFDLFRDHASQFPNEHGSIDESDGHDVLWAEPDDEFEDFYGNGRLLWDSKTQGRPYHYAILAVGMLVESRCPRAAYVIGDIDRGQAEQAKEWADALLEQPIDLPVCVDADRLFRRTLEMYGHVRQAFRRFSTLFRGESCEVWPAIVRNADSAGVHACLIEELKSFAGRGVSDEAIRYLEATGDVAGLIAAVDEIASSGTPDADGISVEELLKTLCAHSITIPLEERRAVPAGVLPPLPEGNSDESLWKTFFKLTLSRPTTELYIRAEDLLDQFVKAEPRHRKPFREIIERSEKKAREDLRWLSEKMSEFGEGGATGESGASTAEASIRDEIARQTPRYTDEEAMARDTGVVIRKVLRSAPDIEGLASREAMLRAMYRATWENQIVLTASSWDEIDALQDLETLTHLVGLASVPSSELHFCNWRRHLLERPALWATLVGPPSSASGC